MTDKEKTERILTFLQYFSGHFGARKLNKALGIEDNDSDSKTHKILEKLAGEGKVEQSLDKKGFRIIIKRKEI